MDLKNISSLTELREQRKKLAVEQRIAIDGVKQNFHTEKTLLTNRVKAEVDQARHLIDDGVEGLQSFLNAGAAGIQSLLGGSGDAEPAPTLNSKIAAERPAQFWENWKLPALGSIAGLMAAIVTFWLTAEEEENEEENPESESENPDQAYRATEADEFGDVPGTTETNGEADYGEFERDITLEQRIHAALASYEEDRQENTQENILLAVAGIVVPVLLRELLNGTLASDIKKIFNKSGDDEAGGKNAMQDLSDSIADELEKVKDSVMAREEA